MINDRDMYYGGYIPTNNIYDGMNGIPNMTGTNQMMPNMQNNYSTSQFNDMNERINRLERQIKRLDQRLTRLETPYMNNLNYNQEPDNNMYMM